MKTTKENENIIADENELRLQEEDTMIENAEYSEEISDQDEAEAEQLVEEMRTTTISNKEIEGLGSLSAALSSECAVPLPDEEIRPLVLRAQEGDEEARNEVILHNLRLIYSVAQKRYFALGGFRGILTLEDIIQTGVLGLNQAILHFNPAATNKFTTYAVYWIRQEIDRTIFNTGRNMRRPPQVVASEIRIANAIKKVEKALGREPEMSELEIFFKGAYTRDQIKAAVDDLRVGDTVSLNVKLDAEETDGATIMDLLPDTEAERPDALDNLQTKELHDAIMKSMEHFSEKKRMIIILLYGLEDGQQRTDIETARKMYELGYTNRVCTRQYINSTRKELFKIMAPKLAKWKEYIA